MYRGQLGLRVGDTAMAILDVDNCSLVHPSALFKQEATFLFGNLRDSTEEIARQIDCVKARVISVETRMLNTFYDLLKSRGCATVAMDREPGLPDDVLRLWDLVENAQAARKRSQLTGGEAGLSAGHLHVSGPRSRGGSSYGPGGHVEEGCTVWRRHRGTTEGNR